MPSLRMKNKSSMCCLREKSCLRVCHKSNTIAKKPSSNLKISQLTAESSTFCESCQDVSACCDMNIHDGTTVSEELLGDKDIQCKQLHSSSDDSAVIEVLDLHSVSCSANLETIFSPSLAQNDVHNGSDIGDNAGTDVDQDTFHLGRADESDGNSGSSSDHQTCNISDFYVSDMVLAGLPFDGGSLCDDIVIFPEYDTAESNIFFDVAERHITLPFLDDSVESGETLDGRSSVEARMDCDTSSFLFAIHQVRPGDQPADLRPYVDSDETQYFDPHSFIRNLPDLSDVVPDDRPTILPKESRERKPVTLVLDLDETLVHSTLEHCEDADFTFTVFFNMREHTVYVKERPHLRTFLKKVAEMFEVVVFTASQSIYAEQLLDILDPDGKLISGRAYRESCIFSDGSYTKDLTVLGLDLAKVVIIDNSPQVFRLQVNNGIPIKSWFDDPSDNELISLIPFLETLAEADDVRPVIAQRFGNKE
uniref:FCP1 homology domain-containing protein n=1 Tax=Opuntia streptacantha TaxID=393608 RepID=A0A7C9DMQ7_OPUST